MAVRVKIPTQLRQLTGGEPEIEVSEASSVGELLEKVGAEHPGLLERILDESGEIRRFVNVYVGDEDVRFLEGLNTRLEGSAVISILPAVAGGEIVWRTDPPVDRRDLSTSVCRFLPRGARLQALQSEEGPATLF